MGLIMKTKDSLQIKGTVKITLTNVKTGKKRVYYEKNMITTAGKEAIAGGLRGDETNNRGIITYCALGTGGTAAALGDTILETELFRKQVSVRSDSNNQAIFRTFYTTDEGNGTLLEAGLFGEGATSSADTGTLFARVTISRTKTSSDTLTLEWTLVIG